jgi:hypothetical protein
MHPGRTTNRWGTCSNNPQPEVCDGKDNNCNGLIDDGLAPSPCTIPGQPGLVYNDTNPTSQCVKGTQPCNGECTGWVGPTTEICDGLDNDCDGQVDEGLTLGQACDGVCGKGTTACIGGALVCQTTVQPQPEVCDGIDNDCNGIVDDGTLADAPQRGRQALLGRACGKLRDAMQLHGVERHGVVVCAVGSELPRHGLADLALPAWAASMPGWWLEVCGRAGAGPRGLRR